MPRTPFVLLAGLLGLAGCATMSVEERAAFCTNTDWQRYGVNDGRLGIPSSDRADLISDCAEIGHPLDVTAYQAGRAEGLREYCTVENGYQVGYIGQRYSQVCPPSLEADFLQGYAKGRDDRPGYAIYPNIGIGIGSGGVSTGVGIGIGVGGFYNDCFYDPFYCGWNRPWGYRYGYNRYAYPYWYNKDHHRHDYSRAPRGYKKEYREYRKQDPRHTRGYSGYKQGYGGYKRGYRGARGPGWPGMGGSKDQPGSAR